ncbi:MAG: YIP1 family protein [Acidobacteriota bacterium]
MADALIETVKLIAMAPGDAFSRLRANGRVIAALLFGLLFSWLGNFFGQMWNLVFGQAMRSVLEGLEGVGDMGGLANLTVTDVPSVIISMIIWPLFFAIGILIGSGIFHLCLLLVGATQNSPNGFEGTLKVMCYAQVSNLLSIVPIIGGLFAVLASLVLTTIGFSKVHRTSLGNAAVAVLIPVALCCICCGIVLVLVVGGSMAALTAGG